LISRRTLNSASRTSIRLSGRSLRFRSSSGSLPVESDRTRAPHETPQTRCLFRGDFPKDKGPGQIPLGDARDVARRVKSGNIGFSPFVHHQPGQAVASTQLDFGGPKLDVVPAKIDFPALEKRSWTGRSVLKRMDSISRIFFREDGSSGSAGAQARERRMIGLREVPAFPLHQEVVQDIQHFPAPDDTDRQQRAVQSFTIVTRWWYSMPVRRAPASKPMTKPSPVLPGKSKVP
jgi:hypothetical protein